MEKVYEQYGKNSPEFKTILNRQNEIDSTNLVRITAIIEEIDQYPGVSLVGYSASKTAFFVLQHAPDSVQTQYYDLIVDAAKNNELKSRISSYVPRPLFNVSRQTANLWNTNSYQT